MEERAIKEVDLIDKEERAISNAATETQSQSTIESIENELQSTIIALPNTTIIPQTAEAALKALQKFQREGAVREQEQKTSTQEVTGFSLPPTADERLQEKETEQEMREVFEEATRLPQTADVSLQQEEEGDGQTLSREHNVDTQANLEDRYPSQSDLVSEGGQLPQLSRPASEEGGDAKETGNQKSEETLVAGDAGEAQVKGEVMSEGRSGNTVEDDKTQSIGDFSQLERDNGGRDAASVEEGSSIQDGTQDQSDVKNETAQSIGDASQMERDNGGRDAASIEEGSIQDGVQDQLEEDTVKNA